MSQVILSSVLFAIILNIAKCVPATSYYGSYSYPYVNGYDDGYHGNSYYDSGYYGSDIDGDGYDEVPLVTAGGPILKQYIAPITSSISKMSLYQTHPSAYNHGGYYGNSGYGSGYYGNGYHDNRYYGGGGYGYGSYGPHYDKTGGYTYYKK